MQLYKLPDRTGKQIPQQKHENGIKSDLHKCPRCSGEALRDQSINNEEVLSKFCPHCGLKMFDDDEEF